MGTDNSYKRYRARQKEEKQKAKAAGLEWPTKPATKNATGALLNKSKVQ